MGVVMVTWSFLILPFAVFERDARVYQRQLILNVYYYLNIFVNLRHEWLLDANRNREQ